MTVIDAEAIAASAYGRCARPDFIVRPIEPTDAAALLRFHAHLSLRFLAENSAMLAVFHGAGFPLAQSRTYDVVELTMEIGPRCL